MSIDNKFQWTDFHVAEFVGFVKSKNKEGEYDIQVIMDQYKLDHAPKCQSPLGIIPEWLWKEQRYHELNKAIERYMEAKLSVPYEWLIEHFSLKNEMQSREESRKQ
jgi:hypothetical protein